MVYLKKPVQQSSRHRNNMENNILKEQMILEEFTNLFVNSEYKNHGDFPNWLYEDIKSWLSSTLTQYKKEIVEEIKDTYDREYQKFCKENKVRRKTPYTIFHKILDSLTPPSPKHRKYIEDSFGYHGCNPQIDGVSDSYKYGRSMGYVYCDCVISKDHEITCEHSPKEERIYPCADCGVLRTKDEGGTTFTVCDDCWDKKYKASPKDTEEKLYWACGCEYGTCACDPRWLIKSGKCRFCKKGKK